MVRAILTTAAVDIVRTCSLLAFFYQPYCKVNPGLVLKSYWIPKNPVELNPLSFDPNNPLRSIGRGTLSSNFNKVIKVSRLFTNIRFNHPRLLIASAQRISLMFKPESVDVVFTDPPYMGLQSYTDLSMIFWFALYNLKMKQGCGELPRLEVIAEEEIPPPIKQPTKSLSEVYRDFMLNVFKAIGNILTRRGVLILLFNHPESIGWQTLVDALSLAGNLSIRAWYWLPGEASGKFGRGRLRGIIAIIAGKIGGINSNAHFYKLNRKLIKWFCTKYGRIINCDESVEVNSLLTAYKHIKRLWRSRN